MGERHPPAAYSIGDCISAHSTLTTTVPQELRRAGGFDSRIAEEVSPWRVRRISRVSIGVHDDVPHSFGSSEEGSTSQPHRGDEQWVQPLLVRSYSRHSKKMEAPTQPIIAATNLLSHGKSKPTLRTSIPLYPSIRLSPIPYISRLHG
jgi:hypothetical protein